MATPKPAAKKRGNRKPPAAKKRAHAGGKPEHVPTQDSQKLVSALVGFGVTQDEIAAYVEIDPKTLRKHYARELATGKTRANAAVARRLFSAAVEEGSVAAMIFWLKVQAGWSEKVQHEHSGTDGGPIEMKITHRVIDPASD